MDGCMYGWMDVRMDAVVFVHMWQLWTNSFCKLRVQSFRIISILNV